jgi:hypothetical protein
MDKKGNVVVIETPKTQVSLNLQPGETGVLRLPIIVRPPTQPGREYPVRVAIRYRAPDLSRFVRPPDGGPPPSVLAISPFKLQVLRDVKFDAHTWNDSAEIITCYFELAPKTMPASTQLPKVQYESLWTNEHMAQEIQLARAHLEDARHLADSSAHGSSYPAFVRVVEERFANRGIPLHPGESMAIAKMMAYTVDEAPGLEQDVDVEQSRWFLALCQVLASDPQLLQKDRHELIAQHVFDAVLYDAILMGFHVLQHKVTENLGSAEERLNYTNRVVAWISGRGQADLNYVYLPLVLGGLAIYRIVRSSRYEHPWDLIDALTEAYQGRIRLAAGETVVVFDMLADLLDKASRTLRSQRIER